MVAILTLNETNHMGARKRLAHNFFILFGSSIISQGLQFGALIHIANVFSPTLFGGWNIAQAWLLYLLRIGEMGLEVVGIRSIARNEDTKNEIIGNIIAFRVVLATTLFVCAIIVVNLGAMEGLVGQLLLIMCFGLFPSAATIEWVFEAEQNIRAVAVAKVVRGLVFCALVVLLVRDETGFLASGWYFVASLLAATALPYFFFNVRSSFRGFLPSRRLATSLLRESLPIAGSTVMTQYVLFAGTVVSSYLVSNEDVGYYSAAQRLVVFLWAYGVVTATRVILPHLTKTLSKSRMDFTLFMTKYLRLVGIFSFLLVTCIFTSSESIIDLLFGLSYGPSGQLLRILVIATLFSLIRSVIELGLIASNRQKLVLVSTGGLGVLYTILIVAFASHYGIEGVPYAALIAELITLLILLLNGSVFKIREVITSLWKPTLVGTVTTSILYLANVNSIVSAFVFGGGMFLIVMYLLDGITKSDFLFFQEVIGFRS